MMATTTEGHLFDRIVAQSQSRSRSGSANSASLNGSLPPPPRRRKPQSPAALPTSPSTSLTMQRPPMAAPATQIAEASNTSPFRNPSLVDTEELRRPSPFAHYDESGQHAHKYADSLSSLNSYSNLFYKPEDDASSSPAIRPTDDPPVDHTNFDDAASMEDYSDLLYPELQSPVSSSQSLRDSIDMRGPSMRKRIPSFASQASHEGPESPVEFANIGALSLPPPMPVLEEYRPSKVDRLLGIDSQSSSRHGSTDRLLMDQARRDSFMEFDIQSFRASPAPTAEATLRSQSSLSDEMPTFATRHIRSIIASQPNNSIGGYKALVEAVDHAATTDASPKLDSRQILVDGSDKQQWSTPSNHNSNRSSASSPPLDARLSTLNFLDKKERADAVRKNRKILQVLGPGVVPSAQTFARTGRTTPTPDTPEQRHDPLHRATRSYSQVVEEARSEALYKTRAGGLAPHRLPNLHTKSSWKALDQDTIFLSASGRRHSSPLNPTFDPLSVPRLESDAASLSSLGSIIVGLERIGDKDDARSRSPASFMEMSDEEGARTPKRRPSIESGEPQVQSRQRTGRAASLNDLLTISGALESPRRVSVPDAPVTDYSSSIASRISSRPASEITFQSSLYGGINTRDDYGLGDVDGDEEGLERQRKREKLAKIHRYLGSKVPPELVLGYSSSSSPPSAIPAVVSPAQRLVPDNRNQEVKKRRRSSSAVMYQHTRGLDPPRRSEMENRAQDTFTDVERMMRIKRAQKLEQIFGESPSRPLSMSVPPRPSSAQGLSRNQSANATTPLKRTTVATPTPEHPQTERGFKPRSPFVWKEGQRPSTSGSSRPSTAQSTTGLMSSYQKDVERDKKSRGKHHQAHSAQITSTPHFPVGTALGSPEDSHGNDVLDISANAMAGYGSKSPVMPGVPTSRQFLDYRNSLNSLSRILDHDDRQSLNDLHAVLDSDEEEEDDPDLQSSALLSGPIDTQRILQPRASIVSINSVATTSTFATLTPDPMAFQARRRRAAKLAQFFGASYRDLFGEVLVRIERGMLEEARAGQISEEEIKHLMKQLNRLKSRQSQLS